MININQNRKRFLFLYLKTGGGHLAPSKAIAECLAKYNGNKVQSILYDGFENSHLIVKKIVVDGYGVLQNKGRLIFKLIYAVHKIEIVAKISSWLVEQFIEKQLEQEIIKVLPDKIIIVHFFLIRPTYNILKKKNLDIPVVTIVTDPFTAHPMWLLRKEQNFILFSEILKNRFLKRGIKDENIKVFPFPLNERYSEKLQLEKIDELKREFGFQTEKILLLLGGGDGLPKGLSILQNIFKNPINYEVAIVCGKNKELFRKVKNWKEKNNIVSLKIYEFTDKIFELINISDAIITKCGASTIMEILISQKIPIVSSYIWEQEKGNVEFILENKLGLYEPNISKLPNLVKEVFNNNPINSNGIKIENGTKQITKYLLG